MIRWILFFLFAALVEWYAFQAFKTAFDSKWLLRAYLLVSFLAFVYLVYAFLKFDRSQGQTHQTLVMLGLFLLIYIPKILVTVFLLAEDILRLIVGAYQYFSQTETPGSFLPGRRKFVSRMALALAAVPFTSIIYGIWQGRYNFRVLKNTVYFDDLPEEFDGFTLLQVSDIHSGSFDNPHKIQYGVDLINQQEYDLLLFTGDIVNTHASEMNEWTEMFSQLKNPEFGKYSILGNHDYGEYVSWPSEKLKQENFEAIKAVHPKIGFQLLLNENVKIKKGNSEIVLIGIENWGRGFKKAGDLQKASENVDKESFKILMSHDPSHWDLEVQNHPLNYQLTLSGHTHGMQFGIEIPGVVKWSPVQYVYKHWAGLYENSGRYLYVNRGFGYHAYPGRVGIWPEITLIELRRKGNA
jgi:predicted MPP superfamily phosphohydrolase